MSSLDDFFLLLVLVELPVTMSQNSSECSSSVNFAMSSGLIVIFQFFLLALFLGLVSFNSRLASPNSSFCFLARVFFCLTTFEPSSAASYIVQISKLPSKERSSSVFFLDLALAGSTSFLMDLALVDLGFSSSGKSETEILESISLRNLTSSDSSTSSLPASCLILFWQSANKVSKLASNYWVSQAVKLSAYLPISLSWWFRQSLKLLYFLLGIAYSVRWLIRSSLSCFACSTSSPSCSSLRPQIYYWILSSVSVSPAGMVSSKRALMTSYRPTLPSKGFRKVQLYFFNCQLTCSFCFPLAYSQCFFSCSLIFFHAYEIMGLSSAALRETFESALSSARFSA